MVRRQVKSCKHKPRSQILRLGSPSISAGYMARHRYGSSVTQAATKGKSLSSNVASQQRSRDATASGSSLNWGYAAVPYQHSPSAQVVEPPGGESVLRTLRNSQIIANTFVLFCFLIWAGHMENRYWFYLIHSWKK